MKLAMVAISQCIVKCVRSGSRSLVRDRPFDLVCDRWEPLSERPSEMYVRGAWAPKTARPAAP
eukprot:7828207-Lingulodinium_polyedra.AAC.1